jgi:hypothetical protein
VDLVDHQGEVDGLVGLRLVGGVGGDDASERHRSRSGCGKERTCSIWLRFSPWSERLLWQPLHLAMSTTLPARGPRGAVHREVEYLIHGAIFGDPLLVVPPDRVISAACLRPDGIGAGSLCRNEVSEGVVQVPSAEHLAVGTGFSDT